MSKVAMITGASRGLGAELAHFLAKQSYDLVITARGEDALEQTTHALETYGGRVTAIAGDVSNPEHRERLGEAVQDFGRLDLLINNASDLGVSPLPSLTTYPLDAMESVLTLKRVEIRNGWLSTDDQLKIGNHINQNRAVIAHRPQDPRLPVG